MATSITYRNANKSLTPATLALIGFALLAASGLVVPGLSPAASWIVFATGVVGAILVPRALLPKNLSALRYNIETKYHLVNVRFHLLTEEIVFATDPATGIDTTYRLTIDSKTNEPFLSN